MRERARALPGNTELALLRLFLSVYDTKEVGRSVGRSGRRAAGRSQWLARAPLALSIALPPAIASVGRSVGPEAAKSRWKQQINGGGAERERERERERGLITADYNDID